MIALEMAQQLHRAHLGEDMQFVRAFDGGRHPPHQQVQCLHEATWVLPLSAVLVQGQKLHADPGSSSSMLAPVWIASGQHWIEQYW